MSLTHAVALVAGMAAGAGAFAQGTAAADSAPYPARALQMGGMGCGGLHVLALPRTRAADGRG